MGIITKKSEITAVFCSLMIFLTLIIALAPYGSAATGFTNDFDMNYAGDTSDPSTRYADALGGNSDAGIEICGVGSPQYVGGFYAIDDSGTMQYALATWKSSTEALGYASTVSGSCYQTTAGDITVSPNYLSTPNPDVYMAAFPGNLFIGYASSANPGTISGSNFQSTSGTANLRGTYSYTRSYSQGSNQISVSTPTITFYKSSGSVSKSASDGDFGISTQRRFAVGVCTDSYGESCADGRVITDYTELATDFDTGLSSVNDQNTYTRYVVMNGLGNSMCIGANLDVISLSESPDPIYYSQTLSVSTTVGNPRDTPDENNGGNVAVTSTFDVWVRIYKQDNTSYVVYDNNFSITDDISPDGTVAINFDWDANALSGIYVIYVTADAGSDIAECSEADNTASTTFELKPVTIPTVIIDGVVNDTFPYANVPYNLSFNLRNSDNDTLSNATVLIAEKNGLSISAPTQLYNLSTDSGNGTVRSGVINTNILTFNTDYYGNATFTYIPTYNRLYLPQYNYTQITDHVGSHSINMSGEQEDGEAFVFVINGSLLSYYPLYINNTNTTTIQDKTLVNQVGVSQMLDFIYQTFTNFLQTVTN